MTTEQKARDMLERMGVPDAQEYSAGELVELANLIVSADTPVALAEAYRCGKEAGDAEIAELRQQLANALAANEHNLTVYHAAAAKLRQQLSERDAAIAELNSNLRMSRWERNEPEALEEIDELRKQLAEVQNELDVVKPYAEECSKWVGTFNDLHQQLSERDTEVKLLRDALEYHQAQTRPIQTTIDALAATEPKP